MKIDTQALAHDDRKKSVSSHKPTPMSQILKKDKGLS